MEKKCNNRKKILLKLCHTSTEVTIKIINGIILRFPKKINTYIHKRM